MIAMQYKIFLPDDYDMDNIRQRVKIMVIRQTAFKI